MNAEAHDLVIDVQGLCKSFEGRRVVNQLDMQVRRGEIYGFLGPNGSGKTTSIRMLCGLLTRALSLPPQTAALSYARRVNARSQRTW